MIFDSWNLKQTKTRGFFVLDNSEVLWASLIKTKINWFRVFSEQSTKSLCAVCFVWLGKIDARAFFRKTSLACGRILRFLLHTRSLQITVLVKFSTVIKLHFSINRFITTRDRWSHSSLSETVETQWKLGITYNSSRIGKEGIKSLYAPFFSSKR